ncbi:MAG: FxLYD domain-containing protein [Acidobacteriia bacterium]|nr:FxLYD domain-containing protein [Terriglobia bacterium]
MLEENVQKPSPGGLKRILASILIVAILISTVGYVIHMVMERYRAAAERRMQDQAREFSSQIEVSDIYINTAKNIIGNHVTYVNGQVANHTGRPVTVLALTFTFLDVNGQRILVDSKQVVDVHKASLKPNEVRDFAVGFERISEDWNHQHPLIKITQLDFGS